MPSMAARVFRGCRSLFAPVTTGGTKKSAAKSKAKPKSKLKPDALVKKTPRTTDIFKATTVSPALAQFFGTDETTRIDAAKEIWTYVKSHDLKVYS
ncbi:unnamed protein product [Eruca vesicaria subsp. sativa]|uniref:DM2 domain-containing protein n=1 Tax=Eruca vesicaria subsp. sativa TaxID=29727 RepID=A0ABC8KII3_ERUVS|nr:unnamed protein product [Eruca vesicaria subsp. sativa]